MKTKNWSEWRSWENWKKMASQQIEERGLSKNLKQIEEQGFTVLTPEQMDDPRLFERTKDALLRVAEEFTGVRPNEESGELGVTDNMGSNQAQNWLFGFLEKDPVFEEIIQHPLTLPLIDYYLGPGCLLSAFNGIVKKQDPMGYGSTLGFHADTHLYPFEPLPDPPMVFNTNWCLSDYTKDNGALAVVPGSHKLRRHPKPGEGVDQAFAVEAPAGSVIVFHGTLWHGAFPRINPGLRMCVTAYYGAFYCRPQEHFPGRISQESLARNGERFRQLLKIDDLWNWEDPRGPIPWRERASGKTYGQIMDQIVTHHGKKYRVEMDHSIVNHAGGVRYVNVDDDEEVVFPQSEKNTGLPGGLTVR